MHNIQQYMWMVRSFMTGGRATKLPPPVEGDILYVTDDETDTYVTDDEADTYITSDSPVSEGGVLYRYFRAIGKQLVRMQNDADSIKYSLMADTDKFTLADAKDWYRRLGIYDSGSVPLADMKAAIQQKQSWPATPLNRQSIGYIEQELRAAGFNVRVYKNKFDDGAGGYTTLSPGQILGTSATAGRAMSGFITAGVSQFGQDGNDRASLCVSYLEPEKDETFPFWVNYKQTIYIAGDEVNTFAEVLAVRRTEFRQLLLELKTVETVAILFINYT